MFVFCNCFDQGFSKWGRRTPRGSTAHPMGFVTRFTLRIFLFSFVTTYLCESGFSHRIVIYAKFRNKFGAESVFRSKLPKIAPKIYSICGKEYVHSSRAYFWISLTVLLRLQKDIELITPTKPYKHPRELELCERVQRFASCNWIALTLVIYSPTAYCFNATTRKKYAYLWKLSNKYNYIEPFSINTLFSSIDFV